MKICAVDLVLPEEIITNDDIVDLIIWHSRDIFDGEVRDLARIVSKLLKRTGAKTRYWSRQRNKPVDYIAQASEQAIRKSGVPRSDIELVVFAGVDRGFYEPANAYFIADFLGLNSAHCFDISDACNGWSRALQVCQGLFGTGQYRNALIVNGEFPMFEGGPVRPELYRIQRMEQLEHRFPSFTLGEATAATVVTAGEDVNWDYKILSCPTYADLCTVSCSEGSRFSKESPLLDRDGTGIFVSFGEVMINKGLDYVVDVFNSISCPKKPISAVFPHAVSCPTIEEAASRIGINHLIYNVFPRVGNIISASVPAALSLAIDDGRVSNGDVAVGWIGSAGMVFSACTFTVHVNHKP